MTLGEPVKVMRRHSTCVRACRGVGTREPIYLVRRAIFVFARAATKARKDERP